MKYPTLFFFSWNDLILKQTEYSTRSLTTLNFNAEVSGAPSDDSYHWSSPVSNWVQMLRTQAGLSISPAEHCMTFQGVEIEVRLQNPSVTRHYLFELAHTVQRQNERQVLDMGVVVRQSWYWNFNRFSSPAVLQLQLDTDAKCQGSDGLLVRADQSV